MGSPFAGAGEPASPNEASYASTTEEIHVVGGDEGQAEAIGMGEKEEMDAEEVAAAGFSRRNRLGRA